MLITTSNDTSERLKQSHVSLLRNECDDVKTFTECGWFCVIGYKGDKRLVYAHCNSSKDYEIAMGLLKQASPFGYGGSDEGGYLISATATYASGDDTTETSTVHFRSESGYLDQECRKRLAEEHFRDASDAETRSVRFCREYWDQLPRSERVIDVEDTLSPSVRY
jgi:hypothetical protein